MFFEVTFWGQNYLKVFYSVDELPFFPNFPTVLNLEPVSLFSSALLKEMYWIKI